MKRFLSLLAVFFLSQASMAFAAVVEDWSGVVSGQNTGTYQDSNGTKVDFVVGAGPKGGEKALQITANIATGGYGGVYHTTTLDLSKSGAFQFMAKSSVAGQVQMAIVDAFGVQYIAKFSVATDWTQVNVPFASFAKDPYYTPPAAVLGHPMDLSKDTNLNFSPQIMGASVVSIGPIEAVGAASAASSSTGTTAAAAPAASGPGLAKPIVVQDFGDIPSNDGKSAGTFQDSQGSTFDFVIKDKTGGKYLVATYSLKGDYCGMWCRAGLNDYAGVTAPGAKNLLVKVYSKIPLELSLSLTDKNANQYTVDSVSVAGGKWETLTIPLSSFSLDKYYTPPAAIKGAPMDFSLIKQFNIQPKTKGDKITFAVDSLMVD